MKNKSLIVVVPAAKIRRHFAPAVRVIPDKKKIAQKKACRSRKF
jgi:hypothetical protein